MITTTDATPVVVTSAESRLHRFTRRWALAAVPMVGLAIAAWQRRWTADDAFINFRVLAEIGADHGPVYNAGDRVEVATSPLWLAVVGLGHLVLRLSLEWTSVGLGIVASVAAIGLAVAGARRLLSRRVSDGADVWWVPIGAFVFASTAAVWDFATGGLENALAWFWLAATFLLSVRVAERPSSRGVAMAAAVSAGIGLLVRPDFAPYTIAFGVLVVVLVWRAVGVWRALAVSAAGLLLPVGFQILRMGYYGQLLPNSVYAKEGGVAWWSQGWRYLRNFAGAYWLVVPVVVLAIGGIALVWRWRGDRRFVAVVAATEGAALVHTVLMVRAGGDYMHARLLLTPWFACLLPFFAMPISRRSVASAPVWIRAAASAGAAVLAAWMLVSIASLRPPAGGLFAGIVDDRVLEIANARVARPVSLEDHLKYLDMTKAQRDEIARRPGWHVLGLGGAPIGPLRAGLPAESYMPTTSAGAVAYGMPTNVYVIDLLGLGNRLLARTALTHRWIPGHEKHLPNVWWAAKLLPPNVAFDPKLNALPVLMLRPGEHEPPTDPATVARDREAATDALRCGDLRELLASSEEPLTFGRFAHNLVDAVRLDGFRVPADPVAARRAVCGRS